MGNLIIGDNIVTLSSGGISARSESSDYPRVNITDKLHLNRHFRSSDTAVNNWLIKINLGSTLQLNGIFLNDVNFSKVKIEGVTTDATTAWASPTYSSTHDITKDEIVDRLKLYVSATDFKNKWIRLFIPTNSTLASTHGVWKIGTIVIVSSAKILSDNMAYGYKKTAEKFYEDIALSHGGFERVNRGDNLRWSGHAVFDNMTTSMESEMWDINKTDISKPLVFYENDGSDEKAYLCLRDDSFSGTVVANGVVKGNMIKFKELI